MDGLLDLLITIVMVPIKALKNASKGLRYVTKNISKFCTWICIKEYHFFRYAWHGLRLPFRVLTNYMNSTYDSLSSKQIEVRQRKEEQSKLKAEEKERKKQERQEALEKKALEVQERKNSEAVQEVETDNTNINAENQEKASLESNFDIPKSSPATVGESMAGAMLTIAGAGMIGNGADNNFNSSMNGQSTEFGGVTPDALNNGIEQVPLESNLNIQSTKVENQMPLESNLEIQQTVENQMPHENNLEIDNSNEVISEENGLNIPGMEPVEELSEEEKQRLENIEKAKEELKHVTRKSTDDFFINEDVEIEKKNLGDYINDFLTAIFMWPINQIKKMKSSAKDSIFARMTRKESDVNRQAMTIAFEGEDVEKTEKKVMWEYVCKNAEGKTVKGYFAAYSRLEVHSFLMSEGMTVYSIRTNKWIQTMYSSVNGNGAKMKTKDLIFFLTQLSTYIKSGIPLVDSMGILTRQFKNKNYQRMFHSMMYDLTMGETFSKTLENQGDSFPSILINMVKSSELTGELPEALDDMADYFTEIEASRKQMISAMTYPAIVFVMCIAVGIFMMVYIVPQFVEIYASMDEASIPGFTVMIMNFSDFLQNNLLWIFVWFIIFILLFMYMYKNVKIFRTFIQWTIMHLPVFGNIVIYKETMTFSKTFSSLLSHNVFITDCMQILRKLTNNEIYKIMILDTVNNLASGEKVSTAFKDNWAFPLPAYEMIVTGERTGQLAEMMSRVAKFYQDEHTNMVARVKSFVEPLVIVFLTAIVGVIVLAIVIPMFSMYSAVGTGM